MHRWVGKPTSQSKLAVFDDCSVSAVGDTHRGTHSGQTRLSRY
ncbi:hypothetical protein RE6C_04810 [Rhodopirellula europaea 6C]|uniref:Uncharacterized protein n=1 Tax=Rhodopirellula europaea 6C TaxID=1263867 RepID=M2AXX6_9BACT|nr:hypothetical protein RE6C_04810 [Rhodopirellula europaea 6C]